MGLLSSPRSTQILSPLRDQAKLSIIGTGWKSEPITVSVKGYYKKSHRWTLQGGLRCDRLYIRLPPTRQYVENQTAS